MRLRCLAPSLQAAALASTIASAGSVDVTYDSTGSANSHNHKLKLIDTNPEVNITYGTTAQSSPSLGSLLDAEKTSDPQCSDPNHSWKLQFLYSKSEKLSSRHVPRIRYSRYWYPTMGPTTIATF
mmetsp:Transcript_61097/g.180729  ORF Transcript_61097/g.180729 Transcript_61097/m.180729 type:complete len:125 (-) Transcript_61097:489-863(-)